MTDTILKSEMRIQFDDVEQGSHLLKNFEHRGGMAVEWDAAGERQLAFLIAEGLKKTDKILDIGCGPLRGGVKIIPYIGPNHYYGIDSSKSTLEAGYNLELNWLNLQDRCTRENLYHSALFQHQRLEHEIIDIGICLSVIQYLPINHLRICLENTRKYFKHDGALYISYLEIPDGQIFSKPYVNMSRFTSFGFKPPYHYYRREMEACAEGAGWAATHLGHWQHPDGEVIMKYMKC